MCYADDLGHCSEVQQLTSAVDKLVFYEEARRLVIITRSLLMTQLQVRRTVSLENLRADYAKLSFFEFSIPENHP